MDKKMQNPPEVDIHEKNNCSCVTECTGLIVVPPEDDAELESYMDVYEFGAPLTEDIEPKNK